MFWSLAVVSGKGEKCIRWLKCHSWPFSYPVEVPRVCNSECICLVGEVTSLMVILVHTYHVFYERSMGERGERLKEGKRREFNQKEGGWREEERMGSGKSGGV